MHASTASPGALESLALPLQPRLMPSLREALRLRRYSLKTEKAYTHWVKRYLRFHHMRHPKEMGAEEVTSFLNHLASERQVAAATQNQALAALLFLYREVLGMELPWLDDLVRAKTAKRLPTVLTRDEVQAILAQLSGTRWLLASLLYGAGLRLNEWLCLRVKDVDFTGSKLVIRQAKGNKDRVTLLPQRLKPVLAAHLEKVKALHAEDLARGLGEAPLPQALAGRYPGAGYSWAWQLAPRAPAMERSSRLSGLGLGAVCGLDDFAVPCMTANGHLHLSGSLLQSGLSSEFAVVSKWVTAVADLLPDDDCRTETSARPLQAATELSPCRSPVPGWFQPTANSKSDVRRRFPGFP